MARTPPGTRADYRAFRILPTRWQDNDEYGHLNNATYYALFDTAVSLWQMDQGSKSGDRRQPNCSSWKAVVAIMRNSAFPTS